MSRSGAWKKRSRLPIPRRCLSTPSSGLEHDTAGGMRLGIEAYTKRWTTSAPYFDNQLDPFALLPDLTPDRIRVVPQGIRSERTRGERAQTLFGFAHGLGNAGVVARGGRPAGGRCTAQLGSADLGQRRAWRGRVRTPASRRSRAGTRAGRARRSISNRCSCTDGTTHEWSDYFTLDLRGSWTWAFESGDLSAVVDLTNATDRRNECCVVLEMEDSSALGSGSG